MSIDRRILSILYSNGINDVNAIEKFLGENNNYYEVIINGKLEKLKIPGKIYTEVFQEKIKKEEKPKKEKITKLETISNLEEIVKEIKKEEELVVVVTKIVEKQLDKTAKSKKVTKPKPEKKIEIVKNLDDDINDFIDSVQFNFLQKARLKSGFFVLKNVKIQKQKKMIFFNEYIKENYKKL